MTKPNPGQNCHILDPSGKWSENCMYIQEIKPDSTLKDPIDPAYLISFTSAPKIGPPLGANVWYRYRYVRGDTGGYSKFSPWTKSPIIAGSKNLPCKTSGCPGVKYSGSQSCDSNLPTIEIEKSDYNIASGVYINVHKYAYPPQHTAPPPPNAQDEIVGIFLPRGDTSYTFTDALSPSPCEKIQCNTPDC